MSMSVVLVTGGYDHKIRFWEATGGACIKVIPHTSSQVNCICISPDKCLIAVGGNPQIHLYEVNGGSDASILTFDGHTGNVTSIGFQKNMKWLYSSSEDNTVKIWDIRNPGCIRTFDCLSSVNSCCLHPNQVEIISGDQNGTMKVWDLNLSSANNHHNANSNTKVNICLRDEYIPLADVPIRSVSIACDASILAVGSHKGHLFIYRRGDTIGTWKLTMDINAHEDEYLLKCVISPDVSYIATTSADKTIKLWNVNDNFSLEKTLAHHQRWVWDAVFSADSLYMVSVSSDQTGKLWNIKTGEVMKTYVGHSLTVSCVALNDCS